MKPHHPIQPGTFIIDPTGTGSPPPVKMKVTWVSGERVGIEFTTADGTDYEGVLAYAFAQRLIDAEAAREEFRLYQNAKRFRRYNRTTKRQ